MLILWRLVVRLRWSWMRLRLRVGRLGKVGFVVRLRLCVVGVVAMGWTAAVAV